MNNQDREAFEAGINPHCRRRNEHGDYVVPEIQDRWDGFQAGAAYQRSIDKGLVEALEALIADYDGEVHNEYDGTNMLDDRLAEINYAREAHAAYRAAQEGK